MSVTITQPALNDERHLWLPPARLRAISFILFSLTFLSDVAATPETEGASDAAKCISADDFRILTLQDGDHSMVDQYVGIDRATGVPLIAKIKGLLGDSDRELRRYVNAFNATILAHVEKHGLPKSSRKKWVDDLTQPTRSFNSRVLLARKPDAAQMVVVQRGGKGIVSSDKRFTLSIERVQVRYGDREIEEQHLIVTADGRKVASRNWIGNDIDVFWGPDGSDTAFFRWTESRPDDSRVIHGALDLRVGEWIAKQESKSPIK